MKNKRSASYRSGLWAEFIVSLYLMGCGYRIIKKRYKTRHGEIDLIVRRGKSLVFTEVKSRKNLDDAVMSVHKKTRSRIENAARHYLMENPAAQNLSLRFAVIGVVLLWNFLPIRLVHVDNAWLEGA